MMKGEVVEDPNEILKKYSNKLNGVLQERASKVVDKIKDEGADYIQNFLACNDDAVKLDSGMVYLPMTEGTGEQPTIASTVEVHYHGQVGIVIVRR